MDKIEKVDGIVFSKNKNKKGAVLPEYALWRKQNEIIDIVNELQGEDGVGIGLDTTEGELLSEDINIEQICEFEEPTEGFTIKELINIDWLIRNSNKKVLDLVGECKVNKIYKKLSKMISEREDTNE